MAGSATTIGKNLEGSVYVAWTYRDMRNVINTGINNITMDIVNVKTGLATGQYVWPTGDTEGAVIDFVGTAVFLGAWKIRANYSNTLEGSPPGSTITQWSEEFFISGDNGPCDGIGTASSNGAEWIKGSSSIGLSWLIFLGLYVVI